MLCVHVDVITLLHVYCISLLNCQRMPYRLLEKVSILSSLRKAMESKLQSSDGFPPLDQVQDEKTRGHYHSPLLQRAREPSIQDRIHRRDAMH